ncbi:DUF5054 domain-containing protein [Microbacterium sp. H1-D42]|uniref:DUF5054 domain-containing protein n=1 Tax=Microbacterium sp. H1-D42 TaxID=2925844 RepID=UPI001F538E49|nr:DUF5054 domain-containing protein [Microbacterium sp. H1-D42]UNK72075.1 DUF5054 domain-containing protein [Microbacterium sp. H1-D42]
MISTIHVVFKTHLDIGFTDLATRVTERYLTSYLPGAIALAEELQRRGGLARFVWTTGSWLIHEALQSSDEDARAQVEAAIRAGHVRWHALPMTLHCEVMDRSLFDHGLAISHRLDERFGVRTVAAKMTDVPGHTIGIVPALASAGVEYLHLGVNGASAVPEVPEFFRWVAPDGSEVVVNYSHGYGAEGLELAIAPGGTDALHLAHTGDNMGPPSAEDVEDLFAQLAEAHPDARIVASTLDDFAGAVLRYRDTLPVLTDEIADSWIHGVGSDPLLTAQLKRLLALRADWIAARELDPRSDEAIGFGDALLLVAEHTWGQDLKTWLPDYVNYAKHDFTAARRRDVIDPALNPAEFDIYAWAYSEHPSHELSYSQFESSWAEQRSYIDRAVAALEPSRAKAAAAALAELLPASTADDGATPLYATPLDPAAVHELGPWRVRFGSDGAIVSLIDDSGADWADDDHRLGAFRYQTFDEHDEQLWVQQYVRRFDETAFWAVPDQTKPGLAIAETQPAQVFEPQLASISRRDVDGEAIVEVRLTMPDAASSLWGAPRNLRIEYCFTATDSTGTGRIEVVLDVTGRDASRLPEASWFGFRPRTGEGDWRMHKLGTPVDPQRVVRNGNRSLHAVSALTHSTGFALHTRDAPLVAVGAPRLFRFENLIAEPDDGLFVNLHNNMWGTNFRMWFDDDLRYRFTLDLSPVSPTEKDRR